MVLLRAVRRSLADLRNAYPYTWNDQLELAEAATLLTTELNMRYPDLTDDAIAALVWTWTFEAWH